MKKKRLDEKGVMESENGPMTFANDFTACTLSYKLHIWLERYSASASTWLAFGALWSGWDGCDGWMGLTPYTWVTIVAPAVLKNHVYLGHCAAHSEESSNGEEGNALDSQPQLLNRGLVLQQVIQLYILNLSSLFHQSQVRSGSYIFCHSLSQSVMLFGKTWFFDVDAPYSAIRSFKSLVLAKKVTDHRVKCFDPPKQESGHLNVYCENIIFF